MKQKVGERNKNGRNDGNELSGKEGKRTKIISPRPER
jgi:hypothetical protein